MNSSLENDTLSKEELEELLIQLPNILHDLEEIVESPAIN